MRLLLLFVGVFVTLQSKCVNADAEDGSENGSRIEVSVAPSSITVTVGDSVEFFCMATKDEVNMIRWSKEDGNGEEQINHINAATQPAKFVLATPPQTGDMVNSQLRIMDVAADDSGHYFCNYGSSRSIGVLKVTYDGLVEIIGNRVIDEEVDMNFTCLVDNSPSYPVTWMKNDKIELPASDLPRIKIEGNVMIIKQASVDHDRGNYTCSSDYNGTKVSGRITVGGVLRLKAPKSVKFTEGERARFECLAIYPKGDPEPDFKWFIGNESIDSEVEEGGRYDIKHSKWEIGSVLHMTDVVFDDAGNYTCVAQSNVTTVQHTIQLRVRDRLAALWPFIGIMSEVILLIIIIFIHEKCTQGDDIGEEDEEEEAAEPIKEKEKISLDGEGDMRMRSSKP